MNNYKNEFIMKKNVWFINFVISCVFFTSCSNNNEVKPEENLEHLHTCKIESKLTDTEMTDLHKKLFEYINSPSTRGYGEESEEKAREILSPLIADGVNIRNQILYYLEKDNNAKTFQKEIDMLDNLNQEQLASLSFVIYNIDDNNPVWGYTISSNGDISPEILNQPYTIGQIADCLSVAFGIDIAKSVYNYIKGTQTLMSASTALEIASAFGRRTIGWIGIAYCAYQFGTCLKNKGYQVAVE